MRGYLVSTTCEMNLATCVAIVCVAIVCVAIVCVAMVSVAMVSVAMVCTCVGMVLISVLTRLYRPKGTSIIS